MVAMNRQNSDVSIFDCIFDDICNDFSILSDFFDGIVPYVVGRVVSSPKYHIWFNLRHDKLHQVLKSLFGDVAKTSI